MATKLCWYFALGILIAATTTVYTNPEHSMLTATIGIGFAILASTKE